MLRTLRSAIVAFTLMLMLVAFAVSCSATDDVNHNENEIDMGTYKEVTIGEILAAPESYAGQRVMVSGRFHALVHIALVVDWYSSAWGIGDGNDILQVYLIPDECLIWSTFPDYEENEAISLPGVVSIDLVGRGRFPSVCLVVNVEDVDVQPSPLTSNVEPESLVGKLIGGTGEIVSMNREEDRCVIETEGGVRLDSRSIDIPEECQVVGFRVRLAGIGCIAGDGPADGIPIQLYYVEQFNG